MRVRIDRRAVAEISDRHEIASEVTAEQLAHVRASAQAVIARAALRGPRHADSIADLDSSHLRTDRFNDAHTAMTLDERHIVRVGSGQAGVRGSGRTCCGRSRLNAQNGADVRVAQVAGLGTDDDLPTSDRAQAEVL